MRHCRALRAATMTTMLACSCGTPDAHDDDRVVLVTFDGLRWQEVFRGADLEAIGALDSSRIDVDSLLALYGGDTPEERRVKVMPFLWRLLAPIGRVYGNRDVGNTVRVTNGHNFSYPGYHELLSGFPDDRIDSNRKVPNPNMTVLEWINRQPGFEGRVAAFASWDVFPYIINESRSGVYVEGGWEEYRAAETRAPLFTINQLSQSLPREWPDIRYDGVTALTAIAHMTIGDPLVLYAALDETDSRAHEGRYDRYLDAARRNDLLLMLFWDAINNVPSYRGRTTLIVTSDHGRGEGTAWTDHGSDVAGAEYTWWAVFGPYTSDHGMVGTEGEMLLGQTAATLAAAVGLDYPAGVAAAAPALEAARIGR